VIGRLLGRAAARVRGGDRERGGFAALELAILTPFVIVLLLLIVAFGRVARAREMVDQAAQAAARAGSLSSSPAAARDAAEEAARAALADGGLSCASMTVSLDTSQFRAGGQVVADVSCSADLSALALSGAPGSATLRAQSTSPIDAYRQLGGAG
jgi:Flp pilus assembly protein TadG